MLLVELLSADLIWPGATPATGALTLVLAEPMAPPTPGGYRLRCWAPPSNASFEGAVPRLDMLLLVLQLLLLLQVGTVPCFSLRTLIG
jgi:hypothetical protein